ncbi:hypothetical protein [Marinifilum caeruleilacunae]|uniref:Uncharacterized protein n=1 Tax=Marinifilum caeruleilacunae TaxID=2499076 RepID=A0ABX1WYP7_9BACT|nr:hypothetical protein [Marinifilum caeruleilacunae]NOU60995.1 hypothetical protein [Marinifilum caeruleilacunae]
MTLFVTVMALASAKAQDPYVALPGATHQFTVSENIGNTYEWKVYIVSNWTDQKDALLADNDGLNGDDDFLFVGGEYQKHQINITFLNEGKYYVIAEEFNSGITCSSRRAFALEVLGSEATIEFKDLVSDDCADADNSFATEMIAMFDSGTELAESQYPVTVNYRLDGDTADRTATITYADKMLNVLGIIEDENNETINNITIMSATTTYGGTLKIVTGKEVHVRTIHALPAKPVITVKN